MPVPVNHAFTAELNGVLYVFGNGTENEPIAESQYLIHNNNEHYWEVQHQMPEPRYAGCGAQVYDRKIWLFGGWTSRPNVPAPHPDVFVFDPKLNRWQKSADLDTPVR